MLTRTGTVFLRQPGQSYRAGAGASRWLIPSTKSHPSSRGRGMKKCLDCGEPAVPYGNGIRRCTKHNRMVFMRRIARKDSKYVPTLAELESIWPDDMICPDCGCTMTMFLQKDGRCATLQHYRDGSLAIVCLACNVRHAHMPWDLYRHLGPGFKWCKGCDKALPRSDFHRHRRKGYPDGHQRKCKSCKNADDRERYHKRKEAANV